MPLFGLTNEGFRPKRLAEILAELRIAHQASFGPDVDVAPESALGQIDGTFAEREALLWELGKAVNDGSIPSSALGVSLDGICEITAVQRRPATKSTVIIKCQGTNGTPLPTGRVVSTSHTGARFISTEAKTIGVTGSVDVPFESQEEGAIAAPAGTLTVIETPVSGWDSAINEEDADTGRELENDIELRARREASLQIIGAAAVDAIRARILDDVEGVTDAFVYENDSDVTDPQGRPPHSIHCVVAGGEPQDIADKIWEVKAGGIATHGTDEIIVVTDSMGFTHDVKFDRAEEVRVWMHIQISVDSSFDLGLAQQWTVTINDNTPGETLTVTINGYDFTITTGATAASTAASLAAEINTGAGVWVPVTAYHAGGGDEFFTITSDFAGCAFVTTWTNETVDGDTNITFDELQANGGDQQNVIEEITDFANGTATQTKVQTIGEDVYLSRYFTPINATPGIIGIDIFVASGVDPYWPTTTPPGGGDWDSNDIVIDADEIAALDTTRITVEVV